MDRSQIEAIHQSAAGQRLAQRQPLPGSVYEIVTDMLMTHAFEPGARLNIEELARTLDVSPTPVETEQVEAVVHDPEDQRTCQGVQDTATAARKLPPPMITAAMALSSMPCPVNGEPALAAPTKSMPPMAPDSPLMT